MKNCFSPWICLVDTRVWYGDFSCNQQIHWFGSLQCHYRGCRGKNLDEWIFVSRRIQHENKIRNRCWHPTLPNEFWNIDFESLISRFLHCIELYFSNIAVICICKNILTSNLLACILWCNELLLADEIRRWEIHHIRRHYQIPLSSELRLAMDTRL